MKKFYSFTKTWFEFIEWIFVFTTLLAIVQEGNNLAIILIAAVTNLLLVFYLTFKTLEYLTKYTKHSKYVSFFNALIGVIVFIFLTYVWNSISFEITAIIRR